MDCVDYLKNNKNCLNYLKDIFKNKKNFIFKINTKNPDYILYDVFGCEHNNPKYNNSIKIAEYSENIIPDFNEADYVLSQAHFSYLDRYFKYPSFIYQLNILNKSYFLIYINIDIKQIRKSILKQPIRTKFCAAVISNNISSDLFRLNFIKQLNKYKKVDMGGFVYNNVGGKVNNKIEFLSSYKFCIAMENTDGDGYISEKIIEAFAGGTIPIYYGDYMIDEYINKRAYILIKSEKDINKKIEYIKKIDNDNKLYKSILSEKIFLYNDITKRTENERKKFFYNIFEQEKNLSKRVDSNNINLNCMLKSKK
jgi:hypothetical protein